MTICAFCGQKSDTAVPVWEKQPKEDGKKECGPWFCDSKMCKALRPRTCDVCLQDKDVENFKNPLVALCIPPVLHVSIRLAAYVGKRILSQRAQ